MATLFTDSEATAPVVLNVEAALERLQGHRQIYHALLQTFIANGRSDIQKLSESLEAGRAAESLRLAHSLRGAASILGAEQLSAQAAQAERLLRSDEGLRMPAAELTSPLDAALDEALAAARQVLASD